MLRKRSAQAAGDAVRVLQTDFLHVQPSDSPFCEVTAVQLDPTCSGSGMVDLSSGASSGGHGGSVAVGVGAGLDGVQGAMALGAGGSCAASAMGGAAKEGEQPPECKQQ